MLITGGINMGGGFFMTMPPQPSYSISANVSAVNEGSAVLYTITTGQVDDGTTLYWTNSGTTSTADFADSANSGSFTITGNTGTVTRSLTSDVTTEGAETIVLEVRTDSTSGPIVATASSVTVNDTSMAPQYMLFAFGANDNGDLGVGDTTYRLSPTQVGSGITWLTISAGYTHSAAIKTDGTLWTWGAGASGGTGTNSTFDINSPQQVGALTTWSKVSCGKFFTLATKTDGTLWSWGLNNFYQLGQGHNINRSSPTQVGSDTTWRLIAAGAQHAIGTTTSYMYGWGYNYAGQTGTNSNTNKSTPTIHNLPFQVGTYDNGTGWQNISAGEQHSAGVYIGGGGTQRYLYTWGYGAALGININGAYRSAPVVVGDANSTWYTSLSKVSCGSGATGIVQTDGKLFTWGSNSYGQLAQNDRVYRSSPTQVGTGTTWLDLAYGSSYSITPLLATKTDGTLWSSGLNNVGQLGLGDTTNRSSPTQVGSSTSWNKIAVGRRHSLATTR